MYGTGRAFIPIEEPLPDHCAVDMGILSHYVSCKEELREYADIYLAQATADFRALAGSCAEDSAENWVKNAHKMRGSAGMAGAKRLEDLCWQAQALTLKTQEDRLALSEEIRKEIERVRKFFKRHSS